MTLIPEFISVLRDIRDTKYPQINAWYNSIFGMNSNIQTIETNVEAIQTDVTNKNNSLKSISVLNPITSVPNQPNGDAGVPSVVYNPITNQFEFAIPMGQQGESMRIDGTVPTIVALYGLTVNIGDIYFVVANSSNYVKLDTGQNLGASDWSTAIPIVPATTFTDLSDTPSGYTGQHGKVPVVSNAETGLVFKTGAELGIIGYNYVKNPLFENFVEEMPFLTTVAFGSNERGYGTFTTLVGTPTLASDHVRVTNGVTVANSLVHTIGKSAIGVRVQLETVLANATIVNCGNMKLFLNGSSRFAITDGTTTNSLTTGMIPNITDKYEIYATDKSLVVLNLTTGLMASSSLQLTVPSQSSGSIILGGTGMIAKFYAIMVQDKSSYVQADGVYTEFCTKWKRLSTGGEVPVIPDIEGFEKGMRFVSGGLASVTKIRMSVGDGGNFAGKEVTFSFTAYSSGVGANSIAVDFVTDRGSQVQTSRLITQSVGTIVLDNGLEKNYVSTFTVNTIADTTFIDMDAEDYFEFTLPASANFWIIVKKPKYEISSIQTEFTPQGGNITTAGSVVPFGGISSTDVQSALYELDSEKAPIDSPTFTGTPTLPTGTIAVTQTAGNNSTKVATTAFTKTQSEAVAIGFGQTWQNVKASRVVGTTYTNSTGKPIQVAIACGNSTGAGTTTFVIGEITVYTATVAFWCPHLFFVIPNGATYSLSVAAFGIVTWSELR